MSWFNPCVCLCLVKSVLTWSIRVGYHTTGDEDNCRTAYFLSMAEILAEYADLIFTVLIFTVTRLLLEQACLWQGSNECKTKESSSLLWGTPNVGSVFYVPSRSLARWGRNCLHSCNRTAGPVLYSPGKYSLEWRNFWMITQLPTESVDHFVARWREKADCCELGETRMRTFATR